MAGAERAGAQQRLRAATATTMCNIHSSRHPKRCVLLQRGMLAGGSPRADRAPGASACGHLAAV
jgi:hypothetical protein